MNYPTLEERVSSLEAQLLQLTSLLKTDRPIASNWLDRLTGSISNDELFLEALEQGRLIRTEDQPVDEVV
jgi:hypothetical protein